VVGSPNIPAATAKALGDQMGSIMQMPDVRERLAGLAMEPAWNPASEFGPYLTKYHQEQRAHFNQLKAKLQ
jgi:hypothetical protein